MQIQKHVTRVRLALLLIVALSFSVVYFRENLREWVVDDTRFAAEIAECAERYGLDPQLVRALVFQESRFNENCVGAQGEIGLMQLLPGGAVAEWSRLTGNPLPGANQLRDAAFNLNIGCWYLARAMFRWKNDPQQLELALCQYNAGPARSAKWAQQNSEKPILERITIDSTRQYVIKIIRRYRRYLEHN